MARAASARARPSARPRRKTSILAQITPKLKEYPIALAPSPLPMLGRETDLRLGRLDAEPLFEGLREGAEFDAGQRFTQRDIDEIEPVLLAALHRAGIGLWIPAIAAI